MSFYDLLLHGGTLLDPAQGIHAIRDVAFAGGRVAAIEEQIDPATAREVIDCRGRTITPGLIDLHVHVYPGVSHLGIEPDPHCIARGVTTAVDAGSAGADTFPGFRKYVIEASATHLFAQLNISSQGMLNPEVGELDDIRFASVPRALKTIQDNRDLILGVKVRLTKHSIVSQAAGIRPLHLAREAADAAGLPIMVHPQDAWTASLEDILAVMRKGDILTHCFHAAPCGIMDDTGRIRSAVWDAVERGIVFDVGHGAGSFNWQVVESAMEQGFLPQTISSDLHIYNLHGPVHDLVTTVAKFLYLGIPLDEAIRKVTATPAQVMGMADDIGTLQVDAWGDAVVLDVQEGHFELVDSAGGKRMGRQMLSPRMVIRQGEVYPIE